MKITIILCLLLFALPAWAGTLFDDFSDGDFEGWTETWMNQNQTTWKVESGVLMCDNLSDWSAFLVIGDSTWQDYVVTCKARFVAARNNLPTFGIGLRHSGLVGAGFKTIWFGLNPFPMQFLGEGAGVVYLEEVQQVTKKEKQMPVEAGRWYNLKVNAQGDHFIFYVDGEEVIDIRDNSLVSGAVGLEAHAAIAEYDNVMITGDNVPDMNLSVNSSGKLTISWARLKVLTVAPL
ncbi:family 16 glycoside hydrolase [Candidatus Poribacteria bacterium]